MFRFNKIGQSFQSLRAFNGNDTCPLSYVLKALTHYGTNMIIQGNGAYFFLDKPDLFCNVMNATLSNNGDKSIVNKFLVLSQAQELPSGHATFNRPFK